MCMHLCVYRYMCVYRNTHVCVYVWEPKKNLRYCFYRDIHLLFVEQSLSLVPGQSRNHQL